MHWTQVSDQFMLITTKQKYSLDGIKNCSDLFAAVAWDTASGLSGSLPLEEASWADVLQDVVARDCAWETTQVKRRGILMNLLLMKRRI